MGVATPEGGSAMTPTPDKTLEELVRAVLEHIQSATADLRAEAERQEQRANVNAELWHKAEARLDELSKSYRVSAEGLQRQLATEREKSAQLERIVVRKKCGCLSMDCTVHGAYICEDLEKFLALTTPPSATEETNL
jgi:hypothetical protein